MSERLNTYIFTNTVYKLLIIGGLCLASHGILAQTKVEFEESNTSIMPSQISSTNPLNIDLFFYGTGSAVNKGELSSTAFTIYNTDHVLIYGSYIDIGLGSEFYRTPNDQWRLGANIGYKYERFAFDKGIFRDLGIKSHWISTDLNISWKVFCLGIKSDIFIDSRIKYNDTFTYQGFNKHCFNSIAWGWYGGLNAKFSFAKLEIRAGMYISPQLNPNAIAYYHSMSSVRIRSFYWEARISFPLFSSRKFFESSIISRTLK